MKVYHYCSNTGRYIGSSDAEPSPLEPDIWLVPANATIDQPPKAAAEELVVWTGARWIVTQLPGISTSYIPDIVELRDATDSVLTAACAAAIVAGIVCDALGAPHTYPTEPTDQANLNGAVTFSLLPDTPLDWQQPLTCRDADGVKARRPHDRPQLYAVAAAVVIHIEGCRARLAALREQLAAATDSAALAAITW